MMKKLLLLAMLCSVLATTAKTKNNFPRPVPGKKSGSQAGISFTQNKGQVSDQHGNPRPDVLFSGNAGSLTYHLRNTGISYQLYKTNAWKKNEALQGKKGWFKKGMRDSVPLSTTVYRLDLEWVGINNDVRMITDAALEGYS